MRYAPGHNEAARERILEAASRLFREHGIAAVGLAKIMAEADLTVGTFYTHFDSKEGCSGKPCFRPCRRETRRSYARSAKATWNGRFAPT